VRQSIENIAGYMVTTKIGTSCVSDIVEWVKAERSEKPCRWLACINPHSFVVALDDPLFSQALHDADWLIPDGVGIVFASKILGGRIRQRVTGSDIFEGVLTELNRLGGGSVFFLGSTEETLEIIRQRIALDYPYIKVIETYSPPFKSEFTEEDDVAMIEVINAARPDILWVGMTAPKQEKWIHKNKDRIKVKFVAAVGAVFDFYSGRVKRSHPVFQRMGLEWLPRLIQEPRRLFRRNFVSSPLFILQVIGQWLKK
jgi:N-acetylglucosaminyldiphosphoundecaprenol N-acetyl-beta-D-mannosaminyltransferase